MWHLYVPPGSLTKLCHKVQTFAFAVRVKTDLETSHAECRAPGLEVMLIDAESTAQVNIRTGTAAGATDTFFPREKAA